MTEIILITGNTNYNLIKGLRFSIPRWGDDYFFDNLPEKELLHPKLQYMYADECFGKKVVITFSDNIINSLILKRVKKEIEFKIYWNNHRIELDELGYVIENKFSEDFLKENKEFAENLSRVRLNISDE